MKELFIDMKHDAVVEARLFSEDIKALRAYDQGFDQAWRDQTGYELEIKLAELFIICPRKYQRTLMYSRLVSFLGTKDITLKIKSRKNRHGNEI